MFYVLVLPFLLSVNSSTSIRAFIQGSLSSPEQQLNLSQLLERQHSPTHLPSAECRQRVRAGASRTGFCPGCLVKGTWHGLERLQENSRNPVRKHLLVAGNSTALLRCSVLARGREERGLAGKDGQDCCGQEQAGDGVRGGQQTRGPRRLGFSWLRCARLRFVCAAVCQRWSVPSTGLAALMPAAFPLLCCRQKALPASFGEV